MSKTKVRIKLDRRDFAKILGTATGSAVFAYLVTTGPLSPFGELKRKQLSTEDVEHGPEGEQHWGMVIDLNKCIGCEYCMRACSAVNDVKKDKPWNIVVEDRSETGSKYFFSRPCLHCNHAPCVEVCPVRATYVRDDGLVVMDYERCIGCRYCEVACPYDARKFNWEARDDKNPYIPTWGVPEVERRPRGVVEKCTFCIHRIDKAKEKNLTPGVDREVTPACVNICPVGARIFGDLKDPESEIAKVLDRVPSIRLREELGTDASVYYIPLTEEV
jgi:Fe-S-cluster-containing dehydrogenase component